ncbi:hypothetical protein YC2023_000363 [Brassica napus]
MQKFQPNMQKYQFLFSMKKLQSNMSVDLDLKQRKYEYGQMHSPYIKYVVCYYQDIKWGMFQHSTSITCDLPFRTKLRSSVGRSPYSSI